MTTNTGSSKGMAITALVFAVLSVILFPAIVFAPLAAIIGLVAMIRAIRRPDRFGGLGMAIASLVIGCIMTFMSLIIMAIAIPNFVNAIQRAHQKRTAADMHMIATGWQTYAVDNDRYCDESWRNVRFVWGNVEREELEQMIVPMYLGEMPMVDGWGNPYELGVECLADGRQSFGVRSAGNDGLFDSEAYEPATTSNFARDLVIIDGNQVQWPRGL